MKIIIAIALSVSILCSVFSLEINNAHSKIVDNERQAIMVFVESQF